MITHTSHVYKMMATRSMSHGIECTNIELKRNTTYLVEYMLPHKISKDNSFFEDALNFYSKI
jgi:hypothetical protein